MATWLVTGCSTGLGRGIARAALEGRLAELEAWRHVSVKSDSKQA